MGWGEVCIFEVLGGGVFEGGEGSADLDRGGWLVGVQERTQEPVLELGVEHGDADAFAGELVGVAVGESLDSPGRRKRHSSDRLARA
jgi:hypothetical protein